MNGHDYVYWSLNTTWKHNLLFPFWWEEFMTCDFDVAWIFFWIPSIDWTHLDVSLLLIYVVTSHAIFISFYGNKKKLFEEVFNMWVKKLNSWVHFVGFISRLCFQYFLVKMYVRRSVKNWNWCCIYDILCKIFLDRWYILFVYLIVKVSYVINLHMYSCICFTRSNISSRFNRKYSICFSDGHVPLMLAQDFTVFLQWSMRKEFFGCFKASPKILFTNKKRGVRWFKRAIS